MMPNWLSTKSKRCIFRFCWWDMPLWNFGMATKNSLRMNAGQDEISYACNCMIQKKEQDRMKKTIQEAITSFYEASTGAPPPRCMVIADLGCSSGPNALNLVSAAVDAAHRHCAQHELTPPETCVFLNDLPGNDFNDVANSLAAFKDSRVDHPAVAAGMIPGSFYERLFAGSSLHLVCSSNSLHWLSKGLINKEKLDSFHIPLYAPFEMEVAEIIEDEGSFETNKMLLHDPFSGMDEALVTPITMALALRAVFEPVIVQHFGSLGEIMDGFMRTVERNISSRGMRPDVLAVEYPLVFLCLSLTRAI